MRTVITALSLLLTMINCKSSPAQNWGTITRGSINDRFAGSSLANNFTTDSDGGAGTLFTQSLVDDSVTPDSFGRGPYDRGLAQAFAGLQFGGNLAPKLKAQAILTGNISDQPPVSGVPVNDARARGTANASEIFQYTGALSTILTLSFTLEGRLVDDPADSGTFISAQVAVFEESGYFFTTAIPNLLDSGVFPKSFDFTSLQILDDTAGIVATRTANLSFRVDPGEIFYLFEQLDTAADRDARAADAFGTLTAQFDQPELVRSLSVPEPATLALFALASLGLVLTFGRRQRACAIAHRGLVATIIVLLASVGQARAALFNANNVAELISAINAANQNAVPDSIALAAGTTFTLTLANISTSGPTGLPTISASESLSIFGNGSIIERSAGIETPAFRLFDVAAGASLSLQDLTLQRGRAFGAGVAAQGGAILSQGTLAMQNVIVQGNHAEGRGSIGNQFSCCQPAHRGIGGGIFSSGSLMIEGGAIHDNLAKGGNGHQSISAFGGGTLPSTHGAPAFGGGLHVAGGAAELSDVGFVDNRSQGGRGGNGHATHGPYGGADGGGGYGGGLYVADGAVNLTDVTLSSNSVSGGAGGNGNGAFPGNGGDGGQAFGGALRFADGTVAVRNSAVMDNAAQGGAAGVKGSSSGSINGSPGLGLGGGIHINMAQAALDEFTQDHVTSNAASTSHPNIYGPYNFLLNQLPGEFNLDGTVDAADYVEWRKNPGGIYTLDDYNEWRANFGQPSGSGSVASGNAAVPEPTTLALLILTAASWCVRRGRAA